IPERTFTNGNRGSLVRSIPVEVSFQLPSAIAAAARETSVHRSIALAWRDQGVARRPGGAALQAQAEDSGARGDGGEGVGGRCGDRKGADRGQGGSLDGGPGAAGVVGEVDAAELCGVGVLAAEGVEGYGADGAFGDAAGVESFRGSAQRGALARDDGVG